VLNCARWRLGLWASFLSEPIPEQLLIIVFIWHWIKYSVSSYILGDGWFHLILLSIPFFTIRWWSTDVWTYHCVIVIYLTLPFVPLVPQWCDMIFHSIGPLSLRLNLFQDHALARWRGTSPVLRVVRGVPDPQLQCWYRTVILNATSRRQSLKVHTLVVVMVTGRGEKVWIVH